MKRLIEFPLEDGIILVEVDVAEPKGGALPAGPKEFLQRSTVQFQQAIGMIKPVVDSMITTLSEVRHPVEEITAELAFKLSVGGALIATLGAEANCKVTLTWKPEKIKHNQDNSNEFGAVTANQGVVSE
jgi:hypothetical protein